MPKLALSNIWHQYDYWNCPVDIVKYHKKGERRRIWNGRVNQKGLKKYPKSERQQIVDRLPDAEEPHRHAEPAVDPESNPALGRPVELGQNDAVDARGGAELLRLFDAVGAGGGVEDQQHLVGSIRHNLSHRPLDFLELFHQVDFGVKPAGGVHQDDVGLAGTRRLDTVVGDGRRVRAVAVRDETGEAIRLSGFVTVVEEPPLPVNDAPEFDEMGNPLDSYE